MKEKRMNKEELLKLIQSIKIDTNEFTILSSGALVLRGILESAGDLDIAVTEKGFIELKENYNLIEKNGIGGTWYIVKDKVECIRDDMAGKKEKYGDYYLQDIYDYLDYLNSIDREKDKKRIPLVEKYIIERKKMGEYIEEDIEIAKKARFNASPKDNEFQVGAALRTKSGKVYTGCNVKNDGIQSICAERTAFVKALSEGEREFESITIIGAEKGKEPVEECMPCGYCRQFMNEYTDKDFKIYVVDKDGKVKKFTIEELLPEAYD